MFDVDADVDRALGFWARCQSVSKQWDVPFSPESRRLVGQVVFSSHIPIDLDNDSELQRAAHRVHLTLWPAATADASGTVPRNQAFLNFLPPQDESPLIHAELSASLPQEDFEALWNLLPSPATLEARGQLRGISYLAPLRLKSNGRSVGVEVTDLKLRVGQGDKVADSWFEERIHVDIRHALLDCCFSNTRGSQTHQVVSELARSMAQCKLDTESLNVAIERSRELIQEARPAFREALKLSLDDWDAWTYSPQDFEKAISDRDKDRIEKMKWQYDQLWKHFSVTSVVLQGEEKHGAALEGFQPKIESLEYLAAKLLSNPKISSPTLEWALIDALVYAECIAFAQTTLSGQSILGMTIPGQLKGLSTPKAAGKQFVRSITSVFMEVVKIGATFILASMLAQENVQTAWLITTVVTAARWIRLALLTKNKRPEVLHLELLNKMAGVHELLNTTDFNARGLRDQLYRVAAEGAVFSPWVLSILDARIRRESEIGR